MKSLLTTLDKYILKKFLGTFFLSILLIVLVVIVFDISEKIEDFLKPDITIHEIIFDYYINFIPYFVNLFSPLFTFIAVIFFTSRMAARTEIVAILCSGVSFNRLLRPYLIGATIIAFTSLFLNMHVIPKANKARLGFMLKYIDNHFIYSGRDIHRQVAPGVFVYMESYNNEANIGTKFTIEKLNGRTLLYKLSAREIRWDSIKSRWSIIDYSKRYINGKKEILVKGAKIDTTLNLNPKDFSRAENRMESMTSSELNSFIENEKMKGSNDVPLYEIEKNKRIAFPFATFILTLIGVSVSSRKTRGGMGRHLGVGLALSFIFIFFMQWFTSYAASGVLPAYIAVWIPNAVFAVIAILMLRKAPK
ncbi:MAG: LptF/LptG family permease [Bacteroidetes bacterium]|jgi:lipopolysaccharide export system permease protein|nr:LptF/LptG family permease [Bacteroidota bacterium]